MKTIKELSEMFVRSKSCIHNTIDLLEITKHFVKVPYRANAVAIDDEGVTKLEEHFLRKQRLSFDNHRSKKNAVKRKFTPGVRDLLLDEYAR